MKNLLTTKQLTLTQIDEIAGLASLYLNEKQRNDSLLKNKVVANLFFENSTRTALSFELAAKQLGAHVLTMNVDGSSVKKGESILDTVKTIEAMGVDFFVIRQTGSGVLDFIQQNINVPIVNAGDGCHQHPSQGLLDYLTIKQSFKEIKGLNIAIVGDIIHSRVARSNLDILSRAGANVSLVGPISLLPMHVDFPSNIKCFNNFAAGTKDADVIIMLRLQNERMKGNFITSTNAFRKDFGMTLERYNNLNKQTIVLHPGPFNRNIEIDSSVINLDKVKIQDQVRNGVATRKAIFEYLSK